MDDLTSATPSDHLCPVCGESKDPARTRVAYVRLGLDKPPEPVLCKCRDTGEVLNEIMRSYADVKSLVNVGVGTSMDVVPPPVLNPVIIESVSGRAVRAVEVRMDTNISELMYKKMQKGLFAETLVSRITELGVSWWMGSGVSAVAKVRMMSNGESTVKVSRYRSKVVPGYTLAFSDEYAFEGTVVHLQYGAQMTELRSTLMITGIKVEIEGMATPRIVRTVLSMLTSVVKTVEAMAREMEEEFMRMVRSADHVVVDVPSADGYTGPFMPKVDGLKLYVFCYAFS